MDIKNLYNFPNLPVPDKKTTINKFLEWAKPIINDQDYEQAKQLVSKYLDSDESEQLHNILLERSKDKNNSWLVDWWIKFMYLSSRGPVTPECNAPMMFSASNINNYDTAQIITLIAYEMAKVYLEVKSNNNLINDQQFNPKKAFSLDQLVYLFASIREPNINFDDYYTNLDTSTFFILMVNNVMYKIEVIKNNQLMSLNEIYSYIKNVISCKESLDVNFNFISSCTNRDEAKKIQDDILSHANNNDAYQDVRNAIFVFSYDATNDTDDKKVMDSFKSSTNFNRFHGKSISLSINDNNKVVICADHTKVDGGTEIYVMNRIEQFFSAKPELKEINVNNKIKTIDFELNNAHKDILKKCHIDYLEYINKADSYYFESNIINRDVCKKLNIVSPDGFIHLVLQIAQYKTNKHFNNTYVAVDVRNFFKGRTECIRPISEVSKQFAIDFVENKMDKETLKNKIKEVFDVHYNRSKQCQNGEGINRYMLGLELAYSQYQDQLKFPKPELFNCVAWKAICQNIFSTTSIVSPNIEWVYFDPVHVNGIGIFYAMKQSFTRMCISYWKKDQKYTKTLLENIDWTIKNLIKALEE